MAEWGRKEYSKAWPSRRPLWTWGAFFLSCLFFAGMLTLEYERSWTAAERLYLSDYLKSGTRGKASATVNDDTAKRKTWFVLDELASLQRLPQLTTAVTENRKSNNPMVLGFQGKSQVEALYGHVAEAMLSQPATKIFLKTSEPHASEWISKAIGEIEIERFRESRTVGKFPRNSENQSRDITREPLVMASEVAGLDPLHGYLKHGNYVLRMRFPYLELESHAEKYIERTVTAAVVKPTAQPESVPVAPQPEVVQVAPQKKPPTPEKRQEQQPAQVNEQHPYFE
jgi:type IV secretory pathway TraG/TraD family ATPase VirD4